MRNAPIDAKDKVPLLGGGHRLSRWLPWYRGRRGEPMEPEAQALCCAVEEELFPRPFSLVVDCHSGFGARDRVWFPYARTKRPFPGLAEVFALKMLFEQTYPHHRLYAIEPQAQHYTAHGDLWDYLYDESQGRSDGVFLPLTLEMGSWLWVKKNPRQMLKFGGMFNPILPHRQQRVLRRYLVLFEFLMRAAQGYRNWLPVGHERARLWEDALRYWYPH